MKSNLTPIQVKDNAGNDRLINIQISYHILQDRTIMYGVYVFIPTPVNVQDMKYVYNLYPFGLTINDKLVTPLNPKLVFSNRFVPIYVGKTTINDSKLEIKYSDANGATKTLLSKTIPTTISPVPDLTIQSEYSYDHYVIQNNSDEPYTIEETWYTNPDDQIGCLLGTATYTLQPGELKSKPTLCRSYNTNGLKVVFDVYTNTNKTDFKGTLIKEIFNTADPLSIDDYTLKHQYLSDVRNELGMLHLNYPNVDLSQYRLVIYYSNANSKINPTNLEGEFIQTVDNLQSKYVSVRQDFAPETLGYCTPPIRYITLIHKETSEVHYITSTPFLNPLKVSAPDKFYGLPLIHAWGLFISSDPSHDYTTAEKKLFADTANNCVYTVLGWVQGEYEATKEIFMNRESLTMTEGTESVTTRTGTVNVDPLPHVLNIRKEPNTTSQILGTFKRGDKFIILETVNATSGTMKFHKLEYNKSFAYVSADWVTVKTTTTQGTISVPRVWTLGDTKLAHGILKDIVFDSVNRYAIIIEDKKTLEIKNIVKVGIV